jgi:hypothetical protein
MSACAPSLAFSIAGRDFPTVCRFCPCGRPLPVTPSLRRMLSTLLPSLDSPHSLWHSDVVDGDSPSLPASRLAARSGPRPIRDRRE